MTVNFTTLATQALRDLGCLRAGQVPSPDLLSDMFARGNQMLDSWLLEELFVLSFPITTVTLTAGLQSYLVGTGATPQTINQVNYGAFNVPRPLGIEDANIILNTFSPVLRTPLELINKDQWADIRIQNLPSALPLKLYYDRDFDSGGQVIGSGFGVINIWPGALNNYGLEWYDCDQIVLRQWVDQTTPYSYPPGYAELIRLGLGVACIPLLVMYCKASRAENIMVPTPFLVQLVQEQFRQSRERIESYNATDPILVGDPAFSASGRRGLWNYITGTQGRSGR
jgi:hypothetical protein